MWADAGFPMGWLGPLNLCLCHSDCGAACCSTDSSSEAHIRSLRLSSLSLQVFLLMTTFLQVTVQVELEDASDLKLPAIQVQPAASEPESSSH